MATIVPTVTYPEKGVARAVWAGMVSGSLVGQSLNFSRYRAITIHVHGVIGGATVQLKGSNDGSQYQPLTADGSNVLTFTTTGVRSVFEVPRAILPEITANASGSTSITVEVVGRGRA
jgi:hypothetical protein